MRVVVVEDEAVVARRLIRLVRRILGGELRSIEHLPTLDDAMRHLASHHADLLFLDLNLHGHDGFDVLEQCAAGSFQTIIVSARHDEALRAFEYGVVDFVAKPYDEERLRAAIARVTERDESLRSRLKYLAVRKGGAIVPIRVDDVLYAKGADDYSEICVRDGSTHLHGKTLGALEQILPAHFDRVHRSYLVNTRMIESYRAEPGSRYLLRLTTGEEIPVSRTRFKELKGRMG